MGWQSANIRQWTAASIASLGLFMTGMFLGWPSPMVSQLRRGAGLTLDLSQSQISWAVSLVYLGSVLSPLAAGSLMDRWGRRGLLRMTSVLALASWLLLIFSTHVVCIFSARILGGMWGGISYCITPVYLSEIAEPNIRGALNTMFTLMLYLGIMFEYFVGAFFYYKTLNLASACVPILFFLLISTIPESPYYFLVGQRKEDARDSLVWLRCRLDVDQELNSIEQSVNADMKKKGTINDLVRAPGARRALFMTQIVAFLQRMSGSSVMMAYISTSVPRDGPVSGDQCAIIMCCLWLVFGVWSTFLVDRLGRKPLLAISCIGCTFATGSLTVWYYITSKTLYTDLSNYKIIPLVGFAVYALFYPFGLACIPSIIQGELFPSNVKGIASGLTAIAVASVSFLNNKLYQPLSDAYGMYVNYLYFTVSSAYGIYFAQCVLIETRNKTLQEIHFELTELNQFVKENDASESEQ